MDLVYERRGSGEPLVLLHGLGSRWQAFSPIMDVLARGFDVWAVDLPGFGASPPPERPIRSIADLVDGVQAWMEGHDLRGAHVAGNSTGGGVALELASRRVVASACGLAPIGFWSARERAFCQISLATTRAMARATRPLARAMAANPAIRAVSFGQYLARPQSLSVDEIEQNVDALIGAPAFGDVAAAFTGYVAPADAADRVPVTIAWGGKDRLLLPRQAQRARHRLPKARHVRLPHVGHLMMYDDPPGVAAVVAGAARAPAPAAA